MRVNFEQFDGFFYILGKPPRACVRTSKRKRRKESRKGVMIMNESTEIKTVKQALAAVKEARSALEYVPEKLKTVEFYLTAVKKNGLALAVG
jgi:hypothetical protein